MMPLVCLLIGKGGGSVWAKDTRGKEKENGFAEERGSGKEEEVRAEKRSADLEDLRCYLLRMSWKVT